MTDLIVRLLFGALPVLAFLAALIYLDSYKLVKVRWVLMTVALGALVAGGAYWIGGAFIARTDLSFVTYSRYVAPLIEETGKALFVVYLIRSHRVGFIVDAAIYGFAIGSGFAVVETLYYAAFLSPDTALAVWMVRGFGTAIMHGGTTAIFSIVAKSLSDRTEGQGITPFLPGLLIAVSLHSVYNHFVLHPVLYTVAILLGLPPLFSFVFARSEQALARWLNVGFDANTELLELIHSGELTSSRIGMYLSSLKNSFSGETVADMLCYLRLHVELALRAKGLLMMREAGFTVEVDSAIRASFEELAYLEQSIGKTGRLAMAPFVQRTSQELWQLHMLDA
jgi:RsiW-degrading membrane proteinase PrsW (M82 family)